MDNHQTRAHRRISKLLGLVLALAGLEACYSPTIQETKPVPNSPDTTTLDADNSLGSDVDVALDTTTQCELNSQPVSDFPSFPVDLPIPPAEVSWTEASSDRLGTGYIGPVETAVTPDTPDYLLVGFANADWVKRVILPLYDQPDGDVQRWMACGWLLEAASAEKGALSLPLFYPGYSGFGMLVLDEAGEWLQLDNGLWVLRSHLQASTVPLAYMSWSQRYQGFMAEQVNYNADDPAADWGYLSPKDADTTLALYPSAATQADAIATFSADTSFLPLAIQGSWMRVRAYTPSNFCDTDWQGETQDGWIRWLDPERGGNQLAEPYKGC